MRIRCARGLLGLALLLGGCVSQPGDARAYRDDAGATAEEVLSAVGTAESYASSLIEGNVHESGAIVAIEQAEEDAEAAVETFSSLQPPDRSSIAFRQQVLDVLDAAANALGGLRVAVRAHRLTDLPGALRRIRTATPPVERLVEELT